MDTNQKRQTIVEYVNEHPTLSKVSKYIAEQNNMEESKVYETFIDFLCVESIGVVDNKVIGVSCFIFDRITKKFVNKTMWNVFNV